MAFREDLAKKKQEELEREVLEAWRREDLFRRCMEARKDAPPFAFYEGPPTANGKPGIHHVFSRTIKDTVCRFQHMRGRLVRRKAGWDTHGLPVELEVEKQLGISGKPQIEEYGIARFNAKCRENIFTYKEEWEKLSERIGFWLDYGDAYITCSNEYIESVWWILKRFFDAGLIYRGHKILPYCARCGTGLSSHEVALGYKEVEDPSATVRFPLLDGEGRPVPGVFFLAWTTTPWTLLSNVALAVHPEIEYVLVRRETEAGEERLWLARERVEAVFGGDEAPEVVESRKGAELLGLRYQCLFPDIPVPEEEKPKLWKVCGADFVSTEEGTGIVHQAAYGQEDWDLIRREGLYPVMAVGADGKVTEEAKGPWKGKWFKEADKEVLRDLQARGLLFESIRMKHSYPHCWRDDQPLMYFATPAWYIRTTELKERMLARNAEIRWVPPEIGKGRFGEWLENNVDWALSRDRYWGTPLPFWVCRECGHVRAVGSVAELGELGGAWEGELDLHRPYVDEVRFPCTREGCKGTMERVSAVADCWFDSGSMPYAQYHYPFENKELLEKEQFPADFIAEGLDQTRGWFYTLHVIGTFLFDSPAYKAVVVNGLILDKEGRKMSKRLGNTVDPWKVIGEHGVDPLRFFLLASGPPHLPKRFDPAGVGEVARKVLGTLWNSFQFFAQYANLDDYRTDLPAPAPSERGRADRWILSRLQTLKKGVLESMENYDLTRALRAVRSFLEDELSNWYIRRSRKRFWGPEKASESGDKAAAYATLAEALRTVALLFAPAMPFSADALWRELRRKDDPPSVHLADFPLPEEDLVDPALEEGMDVVLKVVRLGRQVRAEHNLKVRQPLRRILVGLPPGRSPEVLEDPDFRAQILEELNIKEMEVPKDLGSYREIRVKPNFPVLGKKAGKALKGIQKALQGLSPERAEEVRSSGGITLEVEGVTWRLGPEDLVLDVKEKEGFAVAADQGYTVVLDTTVDEPLRLEGLAREMVSKVQNQRKAAGFAIGDRIRIEVSCPEDVAEAVGKWREMISGETLAEEVRVLAPGEEEGEGWKEWDLNGIPVKVRLEKV